MRGAQVHSLVRELRSHKPDGVAIYIYIYTQLVYDLVTKYSNNKINWISLSTYRLKVKRGKEATKSKMKLGDFN